MFKLCKSNAIFANLFDKLRNLNAFISKFYVYLQTKTINIHKIFSIYGNKTR